MSKKQVSKGPGRPKKDASELKDVDVRIPVTREQREVLKAAADRAGEDFARWAREILLRAAESERDARTGSETG